MSLDNPSQNLSQNLSGELSDTESDELSDTEFGNKGSSFNIHNLPKMNEYKRQLIYFLKFSGIFILFYYITSFCLGFIKSFNFPFSLNNLKTIYQPQKRTRLIFEFIGIILGLLNFMIMLAVLWLLARGFSTTGRVDEIGFFSSNKKGMFAIMMFITMFLSGPNIMIGLINFFVSTKYNIKLPSFLALKSDTSYNKYFALAHQAVLYFSNFMAIIIVKGSEKLINKYRSKKSNDYEDDDIYDDSFDSWESLE